MPKQVIFSGIQPSGVLHVGNYLGAIKQLVELQNTGEAETIFCVVDEHAITAPQEPKELHENTLRAVATYLACGIDPKKSLVFVQSHVSAHAELGWILNTITPLGELERMTQFKDKASKQESIMVGLLNYPTLMAADILLYQTTEVPVGEDQSQHVELTRSIALRFNNRFGETFVVPKLTLTKYGARVMGLDDPTKKMSKSATSAMNYIALTDDAETVMKKIKSATTDSGSEIKFDMEGKPGISNLLTIASIISGKTIAEIESKFSGKTYNDFKIVVAEIIIAHLSPIQNKFNQLMNNPDELLHILRDGAEKANALASKTLADVKQKIGFV